MNKAQRERENFDEFRFDRDIDSPEEGMFYCMWEIKKSLEQIAHTLSKKERS